MKDIANQFVYETQKAIEEVKNDVVAAMNMITETFSQKKSDVKTTSTKDTQSKRKDVPTREHKERTIYLGLDGQKSNTILEESTKLVSELVHKSKEQLQASYEGSKMMLGKAAKFFEELLTEILVFLDELLAGTANGIQEHSTAFYTGLVNQYKQLIILFRKKSN